jgi:precorrin isomerase
MRTHVPIVMRQGAAGGAAVAAAAAAVDVR